MSKRTKKTANGKAPLTVAAIDKLNHGQLNPEYFQRIARRFFKTARINDLVILTHPVNQRHLKIYFEKDGFGYITAKLFVNNRYRCDYQFKISSNKDLFIKIYNNKIL